MLRTFLTSLIALSLLGACAPDLTSAARDADASTDAGSSDVSDLLDIADTSPLVDPDLGGDTAPPPDVDDGVTVDVGPDAEAPAEDVIEVPDVDDEPEPPPTFEVQFTRPTPGARDTSLEDRIIALLDAAPPGATVRAAYFTFSRTRMAEAFARAYERGVDVRIILGNTSVHPGGRLWAAPTLLRERLDDRLTICSEGQSSGGCIGDGINHNKFILFSALDDGSTHVVLQSSANLTNPQLQEFNNMVVIRGDQTLYEAYSNYWYDLRAQQQDPGYYRTTVGDRGTKVYMYPRRSGDTISGVLGNVDCARGASVHVAMAFFTNARDYLASELAALDRAGCDVHVILRESVVNHSPGSRVVSSLQTGGVDLSILREDADPSLHSKYLIIDGAYGSNGTPQRLVWTGSHNYTGPALRRNDETLLKISDDAVYAAFLADWQHIRSVADTLHP